MTDLGKSRADVRQWPIDAVARRALEGFFDQLDLKGTFIPIMNGGGLDFTGADLSGLELAGAELSSARLMGVRLQRASLYMAWTVQNSQKQICRTRTYAAPIFTGRCSPMCS